MSLCVEAVLVVCDSDELIQQNHYMYPYWLYLLELKRIDKSLVWIGKAPMGNRNGYHSIEEAIKIININNTNILTKVYHRTMPTNMDSLLFPYEEYPL